MNWIKSKLISLIIIITSCIFAVFSFEFFLVFENKFKPIEKVQINIHGQDYYFLKSSSTISPSEIKEANPELFILGDSFVEGVHCAKDNANFPSYLSKKLRGKMNVVNLGVNGSSNADYINFLDHFNISKGDIVLIVLYDNDINVSKQNCQHIRRQSEKYDIYVPSYCSSNNFFVDKSNKSFLQKINNKLKKYKTPQLIKESIYQIPSLRKYFYRDNLRSLWSDYESEENKWIRSSLRIMNDQVLNLGGRPFFAYYPNTNKMSIDSKKYIYWLNFIEYIKKEQDIKIFDPYPYFLENAPSNSMVWSLTDKHPNCEAHNLMSEFIFDNLITKEIQK